MLWRHRQRSHSTTAGMLVRARGAIIVFLLAGCAARTETRPINPLVAEESLGTPFKFEAALEKFRERCEGGRFSLEIGKCREGNSSIVWFFYSGGRTEAYQQGGQLQFVEIPPKDGTCFAPRRLQQSARYGQPPDCRPASIRPCADVDQVLGE